MGLTLTLTLWELSVCRLAGDSSPPSPRAFWSLTRTPEEWSLVCETHVALLLKPEKAEHGWRCFKVEGPLDFGLTGILAGISTALAAASISIFAVSTFDTDYILVKAAKLKEAVQALRGTGYEVNADAI